MIAIPGEKALLCSNWPGLDFRDSSKLLVIEREVRLVNSDAAF